mmetsp:Transcript_50802/g.99591  ORF Transcript_50802/g.99591 Transcript_50802/m.99591 type:complete len:418 (-) Transcript_50802:38-1291(-)|eukprot:CAMPEP_0175151308 /NCGR_PEP_ID=MMETSP0087-20121206/18419_1 /TAXON_ID=136419 /ORGANISM="Unknown Unknown, Strain D1" /LENGTH=417 /DNA_ID=CAMNT_0016437481 /DNA_START=66 /DNA_END=1319 /DNA_ORIENTATION=-
MSSNGDEGKEECFVPAGSAIKGAKQFQEDSYFHWKHEHVIVGGVFDGHGGYNGRVASVTCVEYITNWLNENKEVCVGWEVADWRAKIVPLFKNLNTAIREKFLSEYPERYVADNDPFGVVRNKGQGDPVHGGTTASVVFMFRNAEGQVCLICANVGDSTALLCERNHKKCEFLTVDHGPESQVEYKRVAELDPKVYPTKLMFVYDVTKCYRKYECPLVFLPDGSKDQKYVRNPWGNGLHPTNVRYEPAVYAVTPMKINQDCTCIAMTRSLGDFYAQQFGLFWTPSIQIRMLTPGAEIEFTPDEGGEGESKVNVSSPAPSTVAEPKSPSTGGEDELDFTVVVGSDGIWDCWKYEDFTEYLNDCLNKFGDQSMEKVVEEAVEESIKRAKANFGVKHYDDASLVCWRVKIRDSTLSPKGH